MFANVAQAVFVGGGRDNLITRNIFVASSPAIFADNRGVTWQREQSQDPTGHLRRNFGNVPVESEAYRTRYPRLAKLLSDEPGRAKYNRVAGNLFVASREYQFLDDAQSGIALSDNRVAGWEVFKTLDAPKGTYRPEDFELRAPLPARLESELPALLRGVPH